MSSNHCPNCGRLLSDRTFFCPQCRYVLTERINKIPSCSPYENDRVNAQKKATTGKFKDALQSFIRLEWADQITDFLSDIPLIGGLLSIIFVLALTLCAGALVIACVVCVFGFLNSISPVLAGLALLIGMNVLGYCASYVWGARKPWFFWLCLTVTILFLLMVFSS